MDIVETLNITLAPSGIPLSALAFGTIAFTAKVSGVPDLMLQLNAPGGIANTISLPVFHPCVRLARWREKPGELSFVPPDGRFVLAGYEVDLLGGDSLPFSASATKQASSLNLPAIVQVRTGLGPIGAEFEVRLTLSSRFNSSSSATSGPSSSFPRAAGLGSRSSTAFGAGGTSAHPSVDEVIINVPLPAGVRNITDLRASKGDTQYAPGDAGVDWRISGKDVAALMASSHGGAIGALATLRGSVVGSEEDEDTGQAGPAGFGGGGDKWEYDEDGGGYQTATLEVEQSKGYQNEQQMEQKNAKVKMNKVLMPSLATISFSVKGWLASGVRVDSLLVDAKKSRGLGSGVTPYKGVKYFTVSRKGVEVRC